MRLAVFSDVHGNLPALEAVLRAVRGTVDGYVCLGDIVGYGPQNDACLKLVSDLPSAVLLRGNHEEIFATGDTSQCSPLAKEFHSYSSIHFSRPGLLPRTDEAEIGPWDFRHTFREDGKWLYVYDATRIRTAVHRDCCIGHTHRQGILFRDGRRIVNCGSVGQNRIAPERACFALVDTVGGVAELHSVAYDLPGFIGQLARCGYPRRLITRYTRRGRESVLQ